MNQPPPPPQFPRPPRRASMPDPEEAFPDEPPSTRGLPGRYTGSLLSPEVEQRLVRALTTLESIPPLQRSTSERVESVQNELLKLTHQMALDAQRRDLAHERIMETVSKLDARVAVLEKEDQAAKQKDLDAAKASQAHWVRYVITAIVALLSGGLLLGIGRLLR